MSIGHTNRVPAMKAYVLSIALLAAALAPAAAQDIRGLEICTAEKQMDRRTGCLQANVEFLQQALAKQGRDNNDKIASVSRELTAAKAEIAALKAMLAKLNGDVAQMKTKAEPAKK